MSQRGSFLWKRDGTNLRPRNDGDNVLAALSANNIRMYVHSSGQTRIESTSAIRIRGLGGGVYIDTDAANNFYSVYNSAGDDYIAAQAVAAYGGILSTNKYKINIRSKTGEVRFYTPSVHNIVDVYDSAGAVAIRLDATGGNVSHLKDNASAIFGAGSDASVYYDGTNLNINPKLVGAGILDILGTLQVDGYNAADGSAGVSGSFTSADGKTVTVKNGLITSII